MYIKERGQSFEHNIAQGLFGTQSSAHCMIFLIQGHIIFSSKTKRKNHIILKCRYVSSLRFK